MNIHMNELHSSSKSSICDILTRIVTIIIHFLELEPKAFHKTKNLPNIGRYMWVLNA